MNRTDEDMQAIERENKGEMCRRWQTTAADDFLFASAICLSAMLLQVKAQTCSLGTYKDSSSCTRKSVLSTLKPKVEMCLIHADWRTGSSVLTLVIDRMLTWHVHGRTTARFHHLQKLCCREKPIPVRSEQVQLLLPGVLC